MRRTGSLLRTWALVVGCGTSFACADGEENGGALGTAVALGEEVHVEPTTAVSRPDGSARRPFQRFTDALAALSAHPEFEGTLVAGKGRHELPEDTELPKGVKLRIAPGATFALGPDAGLHAQADIHAVGTEEDPIVFTWLDEGERWGSVTNFEPTSQGNVFEYVIFERAGESQWGAVHVRGALSLENAGGRISRCLFRHNEGDDGLSLGKSATRVELSRFEHNLLDAMDIDGQPADGRTEVVQCTFHDNVNDAIDLGEGSTAVIRGNEIWRSGDKGISIGETSMPVIEHNLIVGCSLGIAVKDGSEPVMSHNTLYGNGIGLTAYEAIAGLGIGKGRFTNGIIWASADADTDVPPEHTAFSHSCVGTSRDSNSEVDPTAVVHGIDGEGNITVGAGCDNPLFVRADVLDGDFHLRSEAGRWDATAREWVLDEVTSPCIDAGDPELEVGDEPIPNGGRVNLGFYGGTEEASHSTE